MSPMVIPPTQPKESMRHWMESQGIDWASVVAVGEKIHRDPISGELELGDFMHYIATRQGDPDVDNMMNSLAKGYFDFLREQDNVDSTAVDLSNIPIQEHTAWSIELEFSGFDSDLTPQRSREDAPRQTFSLCCYIRVGPGMEISMLRHMDTYVGLPNSKEVEQFIRKCILTPIPPYEAYLPNLLVLPSKLRHHEAALRPFLDSLPAPFECIVAPQCYDERIGEARYHKSMIDFEAYLKLANNKKEQGNKEFASGNGAGAVEAYGAAIECIEKALIKTDSLDDGMKSRALRAQAIYYANCSAARLLNGQVKDANKALEDAKSAVKSDPHYAKGYIRLSKAYEALGDHSHAEEAIAKALRLPHLANHSGLVEYLTTLQTNGGRLPQK